MKQSKGLDSSGLRQGKEKKTLAGDELRMSYGDQQERKYEQEDLGNISTESTTFWNMAVDFPQDVGLRLHQFCLSLRGPGNPR